MALIGFLTAVNHEGQPQTSPVWFLRDGEDLVVYNRATSPRLRSMARNDRVSLVLRADRHGIGLLTLEGRAAVDESLRPAHEVDGYMAKYGVEIERLGWTPEQFASMYSVGLRIVVTRVRSWDIEQVIAAER